MDDYGSSMVASQIQSLANQIGQDKENQKARDYNSKEAQKSRDYNTWLLQNQTQLKARDARQAGLNPAFMNGSLLSNTPSPSSSPSSPNSFYPIDPQLILSNDLLRAQARNVDVNSQKVETEIERNKIENQYVGDLMKSTIASNGSYVDLNITGADLNREQAKMVAQARSESEMRIAKMVGEMNVMRKQVDILSEEQKIKQIESLWKEREIQATIYNLQSSAMLSRSEAEDIVKTFTYRMYGLVSDAELNQEQKNLVHWDTASQHLKFNLDKTYAEPERLIKLINGCTDALQSVSASVRNYAGAAKDIVKTVAPVSIP